MALADLLRTGTSTDDDGTAQLPDDASGADGGAGSGAGPSDELPADPQPSRRSSKGRRRMRATTAQKKATKAEQDQVRDALTMLYTLPAWTLQLRDPHCGGALMQQREAIIDAMVPIVCRNPAMLAFFTAVDAPWMHYLALVQAFVPVGQAVWGHHVTHTAAAPDMPEGGARVDLSAYSAPSFG